LKRGNLKYWLPAGIFVLLAAVLGIGLTLDPEKVPSPLIGKQAPAFQLARLTGPGTTFQPTDMQGQVWLLNVWASWCVACRTEHEVLNELASRNLVPIVGLNYKDEPDNALRWLRDLGDPYAFSVMDHEGDAGIDWGVYGVPETFLIDRSGVIRYKHIGPVDFADLTQELVPRIKDLQGRS